MPRKSPYPPEVRERAVKMFVEHRDEYPSEWAAMTSVGRQARHDGRDAAVLGPPGRRSTTGRRPGLTTDERQRLKDLEKENRRAPAGQRDLEGRVDFLRDRARRSNRRGSALHRRPAQGPMGSRADLQGPAVRSRHLLRRQAPGRPAARRIRDEALEARDRPGLHAENRGVYGADKVWTQLNREGIAVARCTVERLMRDLGLARRAAGPGTGSAPPSATSAQHRPATSSSATSSPIAPTASGWRTSPT